MTVKQLVKLAEKQGWTTRRTKRGHVVFYAPDGKGTATAPCTTGDYRSIKNTVANLRQIGLKIPTK